MPRAELGTGHDRNWRDEAYCRGMDPDIFFPDTVADVERAKEFCGQCAVREACLDFALANKEDGIWGGTTERERRKLRKAG